jgi:hypothetical protein
MRVVRAPAALAFAVAVPPDGTTSIDSTDHPLARNSSQMYFPRRPAPPVTATFLDMRVSAARKERGAHCGGRAHRGVVLTTTTVARQYRTYLGIGII